MNAEEIISTLREQKYKITKVRSGIIKKFSEAKSPIAAKELLDFFHSQGLKINKTTVYRELTFLLGENIIKEIEFGEGQKRYELEDFKHHHHLICLKCRKVEDVELKTDLEKEEARFLKENQFKVINHSLEFFGYCRDCQH
jgi:Fe2+ or Zn2+ uptake regulation protein